MLLQRVLGACQQPVEVRPGAVQRDRREGVYISWIDDVDFSGPGEICATVIGFSGKPCDEIY